MNAMTTNITGVVLSGGRSLRFGSNKAFATIEGITFIDRVASALSHVCDRTVVSGNPGIYADRTGLRCVADHEPGLGPLGGMASVMDEIDDEMFVFIPCDMPLVTKTEISGIIRALRNGADCAVASVGSRIHRFPLGLSRSAALPVLHGLLANGHHRVGDLIDRLDTVIVNLPTVSAWHMENINTPESLPLAE